MPRFCIPAALALALSGTSATALGRESLGMFAPLVGKCFTADVGEGGRDRHCFTALFGGKHVRDSHRVLIGGKVVYRGETTYSVDGSTVSFLYVNSMGGSGRGEAHKTGSTIAFTGTMRAEPGAAQQSMASTWSLLGSGGYEASDGRGTPVRYRPEGK